MLWLLVDYASDIAFVIQEVQGDEFQDDYHDAKTVESVAVSLLVANGIFFVTSQLYLVKRKREIHKQGLISDVHYLERVSWVEFLFTMFTFCAEDVPGTVLAILVMDATGDRNTFSIIQLATCGAGTIYFVIRSIHRCYRGKRARRSAKEGTQFNRQVIADAKKAPRQDIKNRDIKAKETRKAVKALVKEPARAKKAKKEFDKNSQTVDEIMKPRTVPALDSVLNPPARKSEVV